jgi:hypothetical protein
MADEYEYDDDDDQGNQGGNDHLKELRRKARDADRLQAQLEAQARELAFAKAKLDLDDPKLKYFIKGYEGDLSPEAIREQAIADGFLAKAEQPTPPQDLTAQQRIAAASSGAGETPQPNLHELLSQANSPEEVMRLVAQSGLPTAWNRPE